MIKILTGRQTDPLQEKILEQAIKNYKQDPESKTFIIVPNHIKFTTEVKAINKLALSQNKSETAVANLQVLSFSRLAWYFLKDAQQKMPLPLDDVASAMLLTKIVKKHQDQLLLFKNVNINSGLIKELYKTILQVHEGNLDLDDFDEANLDVETKNKLHDLKIIYDQFIQEIQDKFSTKNEILLQLNELLAQKGDLKNSNFYFTDFSHFSLQEALTIKLLMNKAGSVTLAFKTKNGEIKEAKEGDYDYVIQKTIQNLLHFIKQRNLAYTSNSYPVSPKISKKEYLNGVWTDTIPATKKLDNVQLVKADSRYAEAYFVARTIYQQVALKNYRYQDFLVLAPNLHEYETYLSPILRQNRIPFFNDLQQEMKYHPLVVLIENLAKLFNNPLSSSSILTILKTRLIIPDWYQDIAEYVKDVDQLENFVLAHGIDHSLWQRPLASFLKAEVIRLDKKPEEVEKLDKLRAFIVEKITHFVDQLNKATESKTAAGIFFSFLTKLGVASQLEKWRKKANDEGDLQQAQQPEQLWNLLINLLQDYLLIKPNEFALEEFFNILISGFKEATFSQIPSTLDAVNVSELGMVQNTGYKQVFIIGATSTNLPKIQKTPGFLNSENIEKMQESFSEDSYLEDQQKTNNLDQNYQFGLALALASDQVYLTYPVLNTANEELEPSIFYQRLKMWGAPETAQHDLPDSLQDLLAFLTNPDASLSYLTYLNSTQNSQTVKNLLDLIKTKIPEKVQNVLLANQFDNNPQAIGEDLAAQLYGQNLNVSVSQLETYYQNSYEYFLTYGLRLRKRFENELDVIQAGNYFHETFDRLVKELHAQKLNLTEIDQAELEKLLNTARSQMKEKARYAQLLNDPFNQYLFKCLDRTTSKVARSWKQNLSSTPLRAGYSELSFGLGENVKGIDLALPDLSGKHYANLRGKMDRVDLAKINDQEVLAQVIDYKSSAKKFDLGMFYNGLALQMISYLDVLAKNNLFFAKNSDLSLLGAFYQTITQKVNRLNSKDVISSKLQINQEKIDSKPKLMYQGILSSNQDLLLEADPSLSQKGTASKIYSGVKSKKKEGFSLPRDTSFSDEEIQLLLQYDEYLIRKASSDILSGQIQLNPYRYGKQLSALTYSDYRDIFFFDAMLRENQYHEIKSLNKKDLLAKIKEILKGEND